MHLAVYILEYLLPVLYFATTWAYARAFFSNVKLAESLKSPLLFVTLVLHGLYIITRTASFSHPPITSVFEILTLIAFTVTVTYA